ncbi:hypothetical protein [Streptomyces sp. NPDC001292]|uniref:hypothetical protein n=1 Tax=Streptomyces sp. NPDC001292 TaxID=3364558 RepID=UPI00369A7A50
MSNWPMICAGREMAYPSDRLARRSSATFRRMGSGCPAEATDGGHSSSCAAAMPPRAQEHHMGAKTDVLIPALEDVRDAHAAVIGRFRTNATITPPGTDRQRLESQAIEAEYHLGRIEARVREMRPPRGLMSASGQLMGMVTRGALRVSVLPLEAGVSAVTEILRGSRPADEHRLLRAAEDQYTAAARALATCQAGKDIAERLNDQETAELLAVLSRQNEVLLETSEENLARRARAVAAATEAPRPPRGEAAEGGSLLQAIMRRRRAVMPTTTRVAEKVQGAMTREEGLPIPRFSQLSVREIQQRLRGLSQTELTTIEGYERAHARRPEILNAIERLRQAEPWAGYDVMDPERIKMHLHDVSDDVVRQVLEYEQQHQHRQPVISAARTRMPT